MAGRDFTARTEIDYASNVGTAAANFTLSTGRIATAVAAGRLHNSRRSIALILSHAVHPSDAAVSSQNATRLLQHVATRRWTETSVMQMRASSFLQSLHVIPKLSDRDIELVLTYSYAVAFTRV